jgi:hypothetical protein
MSVLPYAVRILAVKEFEDRRPGRAVFVAMQSGFEFPIRVEDWPGGEPAAVPSIGKWFMLWQHGTVGMLALPLRGAPRLPKRAQVTHLRCAECGCLMQGMESAFCGSKCPMNLKYARSRPLQSMIVETYELKRTRSFARVVRPFLARPQVK